MRRRRRDRVASPYWLYQIWAFIVPGLHASEKKWSRMFAAVAGPLFIVGVAVGYYVLPKGLEVLIGFTPADVNNLVEFGEYFSFLTRMLLVFGIAFEIPLFVVMLNLAGVVSGKQLGPLPALDRARHVRVRRRGDAVDGPVLDADAGGPDAGAVLHLRGHRPGRRPDPRPGRSRHRPVGRRRAVAAVTAPEPPALTDLDPFDLPEWLGETEVTWEPERGSAPATTSAAG